MTYCPHMWGGYQEGLPKLLLFPLFHWSGEQLSVLTCGVVLGGLYMFTVLVVLLVPGGLH